uniref:Pre-mRNA-splicing factor ATP-dependent RNA helicase PRP43 n=1 Tax=Rhabditophanes sp. KR3021 TaxID=114890 RepID=A0AC35UGJ5_9BILA
MPMKDEEILFANEKLTELELRKQSLRKNIINTFDVYDAANEKINESRFHMAGATNGLIPVEKEADYITKGDHLKWEEEKFKAGYHKKSKAPQTNSLLDLIHDNSIDFVLSNQIAGTEKLDELKKKSESERLSKKAQIEATRKSLPVYAYREAFIEAVQQHQVLIIEGETGSGKTTQLPQFLMEAGIIKEGTMLGCTQPRRVAAMSVAARVAEEVGTRVGQKVGYSIRFEDRTCESTILKYMTDGMLLREFLNDPLLLNYSVIIIDEAHERTLHTDILFGLFKEVITERPELRLIIASATLDASKFSKFFDDAPIFRIPGRRHPVDMYYTKAPEADYIDAVIISVLQIHITQPLPGDILVFLTGQEEIESVQDALQERLKHLGSQIKELLVLPIYSNLPSDMQVKIFEPTPPDTRKVVLATNIAETSVTIDGITFVIDPGYVKQNSYNPKSGVEHLQIVPISKAAANQRAGRAGRTAPGKCFRLYTSLAYEKELEDQPVPEIQRTNMLNVVLLLKSLGIHDFLNFDFLDPPSQETLITASEHLYALGGLTHTGELSNLGRKMIEFPCDPCMSKMIIASEKWGCTSEILTIAAMLSVNAGIFYRPKAQIKEAESARKTFEEETGDHFTLLNVYNQWSANEFSKMWCQENYVQYKTMQKARDVREQLEGMLERVEITVSSSTDNISIQKAILSGYFFHSAKVDKTGNYKTVKQRHTVHKHPSSCLAQVPTKWVMYHELVHTSKEFMRTITKIESTWLYEIAPHYYKEAEIGDSTNKKMPKCVDFTILADGWKLEDKHNGVKYSGETENMLKRIRLHRYNVNTSLKLDFVFDKKERFLNKMVIAEKKLAVVKKSIHPKRLLRTLNQFSSTAF